MDPLLILVSPYFMESVNVTCKIVSFLCSLDNFFLKNVIVSFFLEIKCQNGAHLKKKGYFWLTFHFFSHQGKDTKNPFTTYPTYIHTHILLTLLSFFAIPILWNYANLSYMVSLWCDSWCWFFSHHFGAINK